MNKIEKAAVNLKKALGEVRAAYGKPLAKNEIETVASSDGSFSIEFGEEIPGELRKNAVKWLHEKGFALVKDSGKSLDFMKNGSCCIDCSKTPEHPICVSRKRWAV